MHIIIFCEKPGARKCVSDELMIRICDFVNCKIKHNKMHFEICDKNITIDIRPVDILKSVGLMADYILFYDVPMDFYNFWTGNMGGFYTELKTLEEVIQLAIKEE